MKASALFLFSTLAFAADDDWARWRGPNDDGMARGDVPLEWSDTRNVAWKLSIPGRGHSSPVIWGNNSLSLPPFHFAMPQRRHLRVEEERAAERGSVRNIASGFSVSIEIRAN